MEDICSSYGSTRTLLKCGLFLAGLNILLEYMKVSQINTLKIFTS